MPTDIYLKGPPEQLEPVLRWLREHETTVPEDFVEDEQGPRLTVDSDDESAATIRVQELIKGISRELGTTSTDLTWGPEPPDPSV
jgi:hypothetical protein